LPSQCVTCRTWPAVVGGTAGEGAELGDLLLHLRGVVVEKIDCTASAVVIQARCCPATAACPACGTWSSRVHGYYVRRLHDLPLGGRPVLIHLAMRRFLCQNPACRKVTFAGQVDGLTARYRRWSVPLAGLLSQVALELAGRAGVRLAAALGIAVHRSTLLRLVLACQTVRSARRPKYWGSMISRCAAGTSTRPSCSTPPPAGRSRCCLAVRLAASGLAAGASGRVGHLPRPGRCLCRRRPRRRTGRPITLASDNRRPTRTITPVADQPTDRRQELLMGP
jgi:hypothetical protein